MLTQLPKPQALNRKPTVMLVGMVVSILLGGNLVSCVDSREETAKEEQVVTTNEPSYISPAEPPPELTHEPQPPTATQPEVALKSAVGVNYNRLQELLKDGRWKEADQETTRMMLKVANREENELLSDENIAQFPCTDLRTIDELWIQYSDGQFGFSVQKQIYQDSGAQLDGKYPGRGIWHQFQDQVGWRGVAYEQYNFTTSAPPGHLPSLIVSLYYRNFWPTLILTGEEWKLGAFYRTTLDCNL